MKQSKQKSKDVVPQSQIGIACDFFQSKIKLEMLRVRRVLRSTAPLCSGQLSVLYRQSSSATKAVPPSGANLAILRPHLDFKSIATRKDAVAANVVNRRAKADVELVTSLYAQSVEQQKAVDSLRHGACKS